MNPFNLANLAVRVTADPTQYLHTMNLVENRFMRMFSWFNKIAFRLKEVGRVIAFAIVAPLVTLGVASTREFAKFDKAITRTMAIVEDASPRIRRQLERIAMSGRGITGPSERAGILYFLTAAGLSVQTASRAIDDLDMYNLVSGTQDATKNVKELTAALASLGLQAQDPTAYQRNLRSLMDSVARAANITQAEIPDILEAIGGRAAARMKLVSGEVTEAILQQLTSMAAGLVHAGTSPAEARTAIDIAFRDIDRGFREHTNLWRRLNITVWDEMTGKMHEPFTILRQLSALLERTPHRMRAGLLKEMGFQERSMNSIVRILTNMPMFERILGDQARAGGSMARMAEIMSTSFSAQMTIGWNIVKKLAIEIGTNLAPVILQLNKGLGYLIDKYMALNPAVRKTIELLIMFTAISWPLAILVRNLVGTLYFLIGPLLLLTSIIRVILSPLTTLLSIGLSLGAMVLNLGLSIVGLVASFAGFLPAVLVAGGLIAALGTGIFFLIRGVGGLNIAWGEIGTTISEVAKKIFGFFVNFQHNATEIFNWFRNNWTEIWSDAGQLITVFSRNMANNLMVGLRVVGGVFGEFFGWLGENWQTILRDMLMLWITFTTNMIHNVWYALRIIARISSEWLASNWKPLFENAGIIALTVIQNIGHNFAVAFQVVARIIAAVLGFLGNKFIQFGLFIERVMIQVFTDFPGWVQSAIENSLIFFEQFVTRSIQMFGQWGRTITRIIEKALVGDLAGIDQILFGQQAAPKFGDRKRHRVGPFEEIGQDFMRQLNGGDLMPHIAQILREGVRDTRFNPLVNLPQLRAFNPLPQGRMAEIINEERAGMRNPAEGFDGFEANLNQLWERMTGRVTQGWEEMQGPLEGFNSAVRQWPDLRYDIPERAAEEAIRTPEGLPTPNIDDEMGEFDMPEMLENFGDWGRDLGEAGTAVDEMLGNIDNHARSVGDTFKEMSLRRYMLGGLSTPFPTGNEGTESRLDKLIGIQSRLLAIEGQKQAKLGTDIMGLMEQGIQNPGIIAQILNHDQFGKRIGNMTPQDIMRAQGGIAKTMMVGETFRRLRDQGLGASPREIFDVLKGTTFGPMASRITAQEVAAILTNQARLGRLGKVETGLSQGGSMLMRTGEDRDRYRPSLDREGRRIQSVRAQGVEDKLDKLIELARERRAVTR